MTVGDLKRKLAGLSDDRVIVVHDEREGWADATHVSIHYQIKAALHEPHQGSVCPLKADALSQLRRAMEADIREVVVIGSRQDWYSPSPSAEWNGEDE